MTKKQFKKILSRFLTPKMIDILVSEAKDNGYFDNKDNGQEVIKTEKLINGTIVITITPKAIIENDSQFLTSNVGGRGHRTKSNVQGFDLKRMAEKAVNRYK